MEYTHVSKTPDDISLRDVRVRLDSDNATRYTDMADELGWPREVLVNHLLRSIEAVVKTTTITMKPEPETPKAQRQLQTKRQSTWNIKL